MMRMIGCKWDAGFFLQRRSAGRFVRGMKRFFRNMLGTDYRWFSLAAAVVFSVLAAFSVCVFYHMRNYDHVTAYYTSKTASMAKDIFSNGKYLLFLLLALPFTGMFFYTLSNKVEFSMGGVGCSLFFAFNMIVSLSMEHSDLKSILLPLRALGIDMVLHIAAFLGFFLLCHAGVHILYTLLDWKTAKLARSEKEMKGNGWAFLIAVATMWACWTPVFIACYPAVVHADTISALSSFFGTARMDVSFPILTTLFYGCLISLGKALGDTAFGGFLCAAVQAILNSLIMAKAACTARRLTKSNVWYAVIVLFYAVCPLWRRAAVSVLKDVMHSGCFMLFCMQFFACLAEKKTRIRDVVWLGVCMVLVSFTRKATFWLSVICAATLIVYRWKDYLLKYGICLALVMGLFFFCNKVLYPALGFAGEREVENYSLPFQQMAMYVNTHTKEITEEEKKIINETLDYDRLLTDYTPMISAPVKHTFHARGKDHSQFFQLLISYVKKHPFTFLKSLFMGSFEHSNPWYTGIKDSNLYMAKSKDFFDVDFRDSKARWNMNLELLKWLDIPVLRLFMGTGIFSWILLAMIGYASYKRNLWAFLGAFPSLVLWVGLFLSHVNGLLRYGYPLIAASPLVCIFTVYALSIGIKTKEERLEELPPPSPPADKHTPQWLKTFSDSTDEDSYFNADL